MSDVLTRPVARPSVLSLSIKERAALYAAYMPHVKNGGLFLPTQRSYQLGDEIYVLLSLLNEPNKYPIAGKVIWITPAGSQMGKQQGVAIQLPADEGGVALRSKIEEILTGVLNAQRPTHTL